MSVVPKDQPTDRVLLGDRRAFRRTAVQAVVRVVGFGGAMLLIYAFAPFDSPVRGRVVAGLVGCLLGLVAVVAVELRSIARSSHPEVKAVEAVGITLPLALLPFATTYYVMAQATGAAFGTHLSRLDALYFTMTTFSTVGYGDISPKSEVARALVTGQLVVDLVLIGLIAKVILGTAQRRRVSLRDDPADR